MPFKTQNNQGVSSKPHLIQQRKHGFLVAGQRNSLAYLIMVVLRQFIGEVLLHQYVFFIKLYHENEICLQLIESEQQGLVDELLIMAKESKGFVEDHQLLVDQVVEQLILANLIVEDLLVLRYVLLNHFIEEEFLDVGVMEEELI